MGDWWCQAKLCVRNTNDVVTAQQHLITCFSEQTGEGYCIACATKLAFKIV